MATKKVLFNVKGVEMTQNEKNVFEKVVEMAKPVNYKEIAIACNITEKQSIGTLARLESQKGVLKKNEPKKGTFYKKNNAMLESVDLSKITDKEKSVLDIVKTLENTFNYKDITIDSMNDKAKIATLARLNTTYGVIDKVVENGLTTYELEENGE